MISIGTHRHVTVYGVQGWQAGVNPINQRFGATCETCGVWRGPSIEAVHDALVSIPCRVPEQINTGLPSAAELIAQLA